MSDIVSNNEKSTKKLGGVTGKGFMPGVSGNPSGRPKDTLKEYVRKKLSNMSDEQREEYLKGIQKDFQWRMAEGNPKEAVEHSGNIKISNVLDELENE